MRPNQLTPVISIVGLLLVVMGFWLWPSVGDMISITTGFQRFFYAGLSILLCAIIYLGRVQAPPHMNAILSLLGKSSYSLYLLHPIIAIPIIYIARKTEFDQTTAYFLICVPVTLAVSVLTYHNIEYPFMRYAKEIVRGRHDRTQRM